MSGWTLEYNGYEPAQEGLRETLCALGNGYLVTRGAAPDAVADHVHYPGTYLAGGYNRLVSEIAGERIENEDLVNIPNWLPLMLSIDDGPWLRPDAEEILAYRQALDIRHGVLHRDVRFRDKAGRTTRWQEERLVSLADPHLAALKVKVTAEDWQGRLTVRSGLDGSVVNDGVPRYRDLASRHLETLDTEILDPERIALRSRFVQARREVALAARTCLCKHDEAIEPERAVDRAADFVALHLSIEMQAGTALTVEKVAAIYTSRDKAISEPLAAAAAAAEDAPDFDTLLLAHRRAWAERWDEFGIDIHLDDGGEDSVTKLRLHIFHLLQTVSFHSVDLDIGVPPRGWHGEAYRGHIMWDELFIFPFLNLRMPVLTRALLRYRHRRLPAARRMAAEAGYRGAMFPWQSGSDGREESQKVHLNPASGRWIPDNSHRQRHINVAIAYNVWQYYQITDDHEFLRDYGAELVLEVARFFASAVSCNERTGRYDLRGVMGPDEFHTAYPGTVPSEEGGLDNNAYTNLMTSWVLTRALDIVAVLPETTRRNLCARLRLREEELDQWEDISRRLTVPFLGDGVIAQFEGYERLKEFDWEGYKARYGDIHRLDRILEKEGDSPNAYKASKQADVLMLFYLLPAEELAAQMERLGYDFEADAIPRNVEYYLARTAHGSTLSRLVHAWVLARSNRAAAWRLFCEALDSDVCDIQGGTTPEGIHLGAMAGTVDLLQRCFTGIETQANALSFNPVLPQELAGLTATIRYRQHLLDVEIDQESLRIASRPAAVDTITILYRGQARQLAPGCHISFRLIDSRRREAVTGPEA